MDKETIIKNLNSIKADYVLQQEVRMAINAVIDFLEDNNEEQSHNQKILCQDCEKHIGYYDDETNELLEDFEEYNTCDECGKEICVECTYIYNNYYRGFQCCKECLEKIKKEEDEEEWIINQNANS